MPGCSPALLRRPASGQSMARKYAAASGASSLSRDPEDWEVGGRLQSLLRFRETLESYSWEALKAHLKSTNKEDMAPHGKGVGQATPVPAGEEGSDRPAQADGNKFGASGRPCPDSSRPGPGCFSWCRLEAGYRPHVVARTFSPRPTQLVRALPGQPVGLGGGSRRASLSPLDPESSSSEEIRLQGGHG